MRRVVLLGYVVAALLVVGAGTANASAEASIYLGRTSATGLVLENMSTFGGTIGAFSKIVGIEFGLEYSPTASFDIGPIDAGASILNVMGNLVFQIPAGPVLPYGTVGYGAIIANTNVSDWPFDFLGGTVGAFNFGFGAKIFFSQSIGLRVDYRRFALQTGDGDSELRIPLTGITIDTNPDLNRFVIGAAFRW
jgi:hypothetical protein